MSAPEWIIYDSDGEPVCTVQAANKADAIFYGRMEAGADCDAELVTPNLRRAWRNQERREAYARRRDEGLLPSRARPEPEGFECKLSYGASFAIVCEKTFRTRCPSCGRFAVRADFAGAPTFERFRTPHGVACVSFGPACWRCRGLERAPYLPADEASV